MIGDDEDGLVLADGRCWGERALREASCRPIQAVAIQEVDGHANRWEGLELAQAEVDTMRSPYESRWKKCAHGPR